MRNVAWALAALALSGGTVGADTEVTGARVAGAALAPRSRPLVVIDPGHGGSNAGARGAVDGVYEKTVTLAVAGLVAEVLATHGVEVQLARVDDRTLTLRQRMAEANRHAADLFVSVHANASPTRTQRGYETFVLTPAGLEVDARALRSETGTPRRDVDHATALVLDDVERSAAQWEAAELATRMQARLGEVRPEGDRGVRQDAHHVLLGATMPAVLVEIGFIDHPVEGRELAEPGEQREIAQAIAQAIVDQLAATE